MSYHSKQEQHEAVVCPCKRAPLFLSSFTAAEYGDMNALLLRLSKQQQQHHQTLYDSAGNTPLHLAAQHGHTQLVAMLLGSGMYNNNNNNNAIFNESYTISGATPLHRACYSGAASTVQLLLLHINNSSINMSSQAPFSQTCKIVEKYTSEH
jgi:ankyrin repeat protein